MDKKAIDVEKLIKALRVDPFEVGSACLARTMNAAADAIEQMREREKFHVFVWETLGYANMRQLEEMYNQLDEEDE